MTGIYLERLALNRAQYLSERQAVVAENVANANTPGYRARDLPAFGEILAERNVATSGSSNGMWSAQSLADSAVENESSDDSDTLSGNSVNIERQMSSLSDISKSYTLLTNVTRVFNQMYSAVAK